MNPYYDPPEAVAAWVANRRNTLGASEFASAIGRGYGTPLEVYLSKTDPDWPGLTPTPEMMFGHLDEPALARKYELDYGCPLVKVPTLIHPNHRWASMSVDRYGRCPDDGPLLVEFKTANDKRFDPRWGEPETDEVPECYQIQCQIQLEIARWHFEQPPEKCVLFVRFGRCHTERFTIARDQELAEILLEMGREFWTHVETRQPPDPDWSHAGTPKLLARINKPVAGTVAELADDYATVAAEYLALGEEIKALESQREAAKARLIHAAGDASKAVAGNYTITRRLQTRKAYTVAEATFPTFAVKANAIPCTGVTCD